MADLKPKDEVLASGALPDDDEEEEEPEEELKQE